MKKIAKKQTKADTRSVKPAYTKGEKTRAKILVAAARLFSERGYSGTALSDVMAACGLTKGGFYAHFASKEDLYLESVRGLLERERIKYKRAPHDAPAEARLAAFLKWMGESLSGDKPLGRQFLWMLVEPDINITKHVIDEVFRPTYNELSELLSGRSPSLHSELIAPSLLAVALLYDQIRTSIMAPLVPSSAKKIETAAVLDFLLEREKALAKEKNGGATRRATGGVRTLRNPA